MAQGKISEKQREILEYIKNEILNKGYPPAVRDICEAVHLKSTSSVHSHLETLEKNGYIRRDPSKPRAIEIIDDTFQLVRREVVLLPETPYWQWRTWNLISPFPQNLCPMPRRLC